MTSKVTGNWLPDQHPMKRKLYRKGVWKNFGIHVDLKYSITIPSWVPLKNIIVYRVGNACQWRYQRRYINCGVSKNNNDSLNTWLQRSLVIGNWLPDQHPVKRKLYRKVWKNFGIDLKYSITCLRVCLSWINIKVMLILFFCYLFFFRKFPVQVRF